MTKATVVAKQAGKIWLQIQPGHLTGCSGCSQNKLGCSAMLMKKGQATEIILELPVEQSYALGCVGQFEPGRNIPLLAILVYCVPIVGLLLGMLVAQTITFDFFHQVDDNSTLIQAVFGLIGLGLGYGLLRFLLKKFNRNIFHYIT